MDGAVRPVSGVLPAALAARQAGFDRLLVPCANSAEAATLPGLKVFGVPSLTAAIQHLNGESQLPAAEIDASEPGAVRPAAVELADIAGHAAVRRALELAAAGGHHLLLTGPPGTGKTLLARALPGLLPRLTFDESVQTSTVYSAIGRMNGCGLLQRRPFRAPHHSVTVAGLIGGGSPPRPGEISLAHNGVLFLDELAEFRRPVLEALRHLWKSPRSCWCAATTRCGCRLASSS